MQKLEKMSGNRPIELVERKGEGKKLIEYYGDFVPEQWITAAGAESYLIMKGGDPQAPEATLDYSLRFMNPLAASMVGNYLSGALTASCLWPTVLPSSSTTATTAA